MLCNVESCKEARVSGHTYCSPHLKVTRPCIGKTRSGLECHRLVLGKNQYCIKHKKPEIKLCSGFKKNFQKCTRHCIHPSKYCKIHTLQEKKPRKTKRYQCGVIIKKGNTITTCKKIVRSSHSNHEFCHLHKIRQVCHVEKPIIIICKGLTKTLKKCNRSCKPPLEYCKYHLTQKHNPRKSKRYQCGAPVVFKNKVKKCKIILASYDDTKKFCRRHENKIFNYKPCGQFVTVGNYCPVLVNKHYEKFCKKHKKGPHITETIITLNDKIWAPYIKIIESKPEEQVKELLGPHFTKKWAKRCKNMKGHPERGSPHVNKLLPARRNRTKSILKKSST